MLELLEAAVVAYEPVEGAPRLASLPDRRFHALAPDGVKLEVYASGHPLRPAPWTLEIRTTAPLCDGACGDGPCTPPPARWPTLEELARIVDVVMPAGMACVLPLMSRGAAHRDRELADGGTRVMHLNGVMIGRPPAAAGSALVGARG